MAGLVIRGDLSHVAQSLAGLVIREDLSHVAHSLAGSVMWGIVRVVHRCGVVIYAMRVITQYAYHCVLCWVRT